MYQPLAVRGAEPPRNLARGVHGLAERQGTGSQVLAQRLAGQELHHDVDLAFVQARVVNRDDVRMRERGEGLCFALEPGAALGVAAKALRQQLDGNVSSQAHVPRAIDVAHPPGPDEGSNLVGTNVSAGRQGHAGRRSLARSPAAVLKIGS